MQSLLSPHGVYAVADVDAALARVCGVGVRPLHMEQALFDAMLSGWRVGDPPSVGGRRKSGRDIRTILVRLNSRELAVDYR